MFTMQSLGFYPGTIEDAAEKAEAAMQEAGVPSLTIDAMYVTAREKFENGELDYSDITNSFINEFYNYAKYYIEKAIAGIEITYYVNGDDSHLYVNGEGYCKGDDTIRNYRYGLDICFISKDYFEGVAACNAALSIEDEELLADIIESAENKDGEYFYNLSENNNEFWADAYDMIAAADNNRIALDVNAILQTNGEILFEVKIDSPNPDECFKGITSPKSLTKETEIMEKLETAIRGYEIDAVDEDAVELFQKYLKNHEKPKENSKEYNV